MSVPLSGGGGKSDPGPARPARTGADPSAGDKPGSSGRGDRDQPGRTTIAPSVVAIVAGVAARSVRGVHTLGGGSGGGSAAGAALSRVRTALPNGGSSSADGVQVEVGEVQAAFDLSLVADYGVPLRRLAEDVRERVIARVEELTGYEVTEVNIAVVDVHLDEEDDA